MLQNPAKFPLYRLPVLPLQEIVKSMELDVMFFFSLTSSKAKTMLKISLLKNDLHLDCSLCEKSITLKFPSCSDKFVLKFSNRVPNGNRIFQTRNVQFRYFKCRDAITIRGNEPLVVMVRELITHLAVSLHLPKISMDFQAVLSPDVALDQLNNLKSLSLPIVRIELGTQNTPAEIYKAFLDEGSRITESLIMGCRAPVSFQYTPPEDFHLERFVVQDGYWVNLEDYMNCRHVIVHNATLSPNMYCLNAQRLNQFFKNWQRSGCHLERLEIDLSSDFASRVVNFEDVIAGLNGTNITRNDYVQSVDIERQDGKKATIRLYSNSLFLITKS